MSHEPPDPAPGGPVIEFRNVHKYFGTLHVLQDLNLLVREGEVLVVCGPSGAGKSTLVRCVNGLESIDAGSLQVLGTKLNEGSPDLRRLRSNIGIVFQNFNLYPHLTALKNVTLAPVRVRKLTRRQADARGRELLAQVGISDKADRYPAQLSGGQRQRLAIARALAMDPKIMLFDEPTSALDPEMIRGILDLVARLARAGMTMLVVTHEMGFARAVADRVAFMDLGRIVESSDPKGFFDHPQHERTRIFLSQVLPR